VTNIAKDGQITAQETKGARTFQFQVADPALRRGLRVGSPVYANFDTRQVSLDGKKPCCKILNISTAAKQAVPGTIPVAPGSVDSEPGSTGSAATKGTKSKSSGGGLDSIKPGEIPPVTVSPEPSTAGAMRGRPPTAPTATKKITPPELGPVQPFNAKPGGLPSPQQTDLAVTSFGLTADARMTYTVVNRGRTAANSPFVVDLFIDGKREDTVKHNALPPLSQQRVISNLARPEVCSAVQLRIALDTQQLVNEADEANNSQSRQMVPPCPDLVVDIDKDSVSNGLKYRAKVQVTNKGNLTTKREFYVLLKGSGSGLAFAAMPILKRKRMDPLAPGQTVSFYESGDHLGTSTFHYGVLADQLEEIRESNENNNYKGETMGGGY
jgi:hypothetical protein